MPNRDDRFVDSLQFKITSTVFCILVALLIFSAVASGVGLFSTMEVLQDSEEMNETPTIDDYNAVKSITAEESSILVQTSNHPRFASSGDWGDYEITHIKLVSEDGSVNKRVERSTGQTQFEFEAEEINGNYTLLLIHHVPEDPGLFGHAETDYEQITTFSVENSDVTNVSVPDEAKYD